MAVPQWIDVNFASLGFGFWLVVPRCLKEGDCNLKRTGDSGHSFHPGDAEC